jgi:hypothetical protein
MSSYSLRALNGQLRYGLGEVIPLLAEITDRVTIRCVVSSIRIWSIVRIISSSIPVGKGHLTELVRRDDRIEYGEIGTIVVGFD